MLICILEQRQHFPPTTFRVSSPKTNHAAKPVWVCVFLSGSLWPCCSNCRRDGCSSFSREPGPLWCLSWPLVAQAGASVRAGLCRAPWQGDAAAAAACPASPCGTHRGCASALQDGTGALGEGAGEVQQEGEHTAGGPCSAWALSAALAKPRL